MEQPKKQSNINDSTGLNDHRPMYASNTHTH